MKKLLLSILEFLKEVTMSRKQLKEFQTKIINLQKDCDSYQERYYTNYHKFDNCSNCKYYQEQNHRYEKEVIVLKDLVEEKNMVIDKLTSLKTTKKKDLTNES